MPSKILPIRKCFLSLLFIKYAVFKFTFFVGTLHHVCLIKTFAVVGIKKKQNKIVDGLFTQQVLILQSEYLCTPKVAIIHFSW